MWSLSSSIVKERIDVWEDRRFGFPYRFNYYNAPAKLLRSCILYKRICWTRIYLPLNKKKCLTMLIMHLLTPRDPARIRKLGIYLIICTEYIDKRQERVFRVYFFHPSEAKRVKLITFKMILYYFKKILKAEIRVFIQDFGVKESHRNLSFFVDQKGVVLRR